jgi:uncharacterized protein (TIGR02466 family)
LIEKHTKPEMFWPTPTLTLQLAGVEELNQGLARIIREKEKEILAKAKPTPVAGVKMGLTAHWLEFNVLNWDYPEIAQLRGLVLDGIREMFKLLGEDPDSPGMQIAGISCWANVLRFGEFLEVHHHDPSFLSAHYQVQTGYEVGKPPSKDEGGQTVYFRPGFLDRSMGGKAAGQTSPWDADWKTSVEPVEGKLFFFPSYVRHEVRPYLGSHERISIAMDIFVKKQEALMHFGGPRWFVPGKPQASRPPLKPR